MASRAAILRAAQAAPGAAQPTAPPQGSGSPWIGQLPSYSTTPGSGYSNPYGPFLPRPQQTFTEGAFGPFSPILPVPVDQPPPGDPRAQPRRWQYQVGWNLPVGQPGSEGYKLASYQTLRTLADTYSILRTCIERRKNEIRALEWDITLTQDAAKAYQGDREAMRDFGERRGKALKFFKRPDPNYFDMGSWLHAMMDQVFTYDALSLYMCPKRGKGLGRGLLGSDLDSLWLIDGSTIRPLLGLHGERPGPPAPAFQQMLYGVPRADLATMAEGLDLRDAGMTEHDVRTLLRGDQLIYYPYLQRPDSPYGFPIVEQALIPIMTGLRKQAYQLDFFNEGTVPRVYISPGDTTMTPNQIRELQDALNAVAGDIAWAFKIQVLPPGSKVMPQKEMAIVDDADNWIATEVAMVCDVSPVELGLLPKVSAMASPFAAREAAQASRSIHERTSTKPTLSYIAGIFNLILQVVCGQDDMRFVFNGMEETQDIAALTDTGVKQVQSGVKSIDEFRGDLHLPPWNLPETSGPVVFTQLGPVPLGQAASDTVAQQREMISGAHDSARAGSSKPKRKALPAGTSGQGRMNGPVTQRQARRGGALAPAHAMAEGSPGHSGASAPKAALTDVELGLITAEQKALSDDQGLDWTAKAALAELEALGRHLRKGMQPVEWTPVHIPGSVMAVISDDLGKGLSAGYVLAQARAAVGKATPQQQHQRQQMAQIAARFQAQIAAAFGAALSAATNLIRAWMAGTLAVTAAVLAGMIADLIREALQQVLHALWVAAWEAAVRSEGGDPAKTKVAMEAFIASEGAQWASLISGTGMAALLAAITAALRAGDVSAVLGQLRDILDPAGRSESIAVSEVTRAWNAALLAYYRAVGVAYKVWITRDDAKVCAKCKANQDQGPVELSKPFKSGDLAPLAHPNCRCRLGAYVPGRRKSAAVLRREVGLNGQETWTEYVEGDNAAGGGGRVFQPHRADGTMIPQGGVPGASAGGEPPRWDGTEPDPVVERAPDSDDDDAYGSAAGIGARPGTYWPAQYMDGYWPAPHGHGTTQPAASSIGAANGRPPNSVGKGAGNAAAEFLKDAPEAKASVVRKQMLENFPPSALAWVKRIRWVGPVDVPVKLMDTAGKDKWAASHETAHVNEIARDLKAGKPVNAVIGVLREGHNHVRLIDGRHRTLAHEKLRQPVRCFVGYLDDANETAAYDTYHQQFHSGDDPKNKSFTAGNLGDGSAHGLVPFNLLGAKVPKESVGYGPARDLSVSCGNCSMFIAGGSCTDVEGDISPEDHCVLWKARGPAKSADVAGPHDESSLPGPPFGAPYCAGLVVHAADTGRLLMLQRAVSEDDDGAGLLEWPGGHAEDGESLIDGAMREWAEETGHPVPRGTLTGHFESSNGVYAAFILTIPREADLDLNAPRQVENPDGDAFERAIWIDPAHLGGNRAVRNEVLTDLPLLLHALTGTETKSAETPVVSTQHHPLGHEGLWHTPDRHVATMQQLPAYHQNTARALMRDQGMGESQAIATAINAIREWRHGTAFGGKVKVTPEVQEAAARADDEWERLKESHHGGAQ